MAWSKVTTTIQNPATKGAHMTAKQIKYFGTKRQKAALKAKRSKARSSTKKRHSARRPNPSPKRKQVKRSKPSARRTRPRKTSHRLRTVKRNPPELVAFLTGNPAPKGHKKVARSKRKYSKKSAARKNTGTRRSMKKRVSRHSSRRKNPAGISIREMAYGGAGVLGGFFGSAGLTQLFLGSSNTGVTGYAVTAGIAIGLTILTHMVFPRERALTFGVGAGGVANLMRRIVMDKTPFGSYLSSTGMGDYMVANWGPPRLPDAMHSAMAEPAGTPWGGPAMVATSSGASATDLMDVRQSRPC